ncbi:unnamed protein product [Caenorhabditis angaria]|uniref:CUB-like domain-containing protein n=1 Tax=Caenorhabditis angaria TaxID=860376 RepID=A0A9P1IT18_9PELO|nr:unnamed protein product [Caenorhabditis angaria]
MNILLIILSIAPSIVSAANEIKLEPNVFRVTGTYQPVNIEYGFPSLASFSYINEQMDNEFSHINFEFVPIEYCQFVRICIAKAISYTKKLKHKITEDQCEDYITYIPTTGAIKIKYDKINVEGYTSSLNMTGTTNGRRVFYWKNIFYNENSFRDNKFMHQDLDFKNKMFLVFTNSRQCHPIIMIDGTISNMEIYGTKSISDSLPSEFEYLQIGKTNPTLYTATDVTGVERSVDYFPVLKSLTEAKDGIGQLKFKCKMAGGGITKNIISKTSVIEVVKKVNTNANNANEAKVLIELEDCHWMRIWFSKDSATWSDYATTFLPKHSIDFLLSEGLVFLPDRENAVRIPMSVNDISHLTLKYHPKNQIIEILFGHSNDFQYPITFKSDIMKEGTFKIFMIRSPKCDAVFGSNSRGILAHGSDSRKNEFLFTNLQSIFD